MRATDRTPPPARTPDAPRRAAGLTVVVNARASGAPRGAALDAILAALRRHADPHAGVRLERTSSLEDLAGVWGRRDGDRVVLVGGDGSVHAVANLDGPPRDVALIPAGRANNIARSTGIPLDHGAAARLAASGSVRPIDLIEARAGALHQVVVESVSAGFLAQARCRYHGRNSADLCAGLRAGAAALAAFHPLGAHVHRPEGDEDLTLAQVFVANLPLYEFGLRVAPHADPTDATLDVIALEARSRAAVLRLLADLVRGRHLRRPGTHLWRAREVVIATGGASPIVADSADLGPGPVSLRALPRALHLVRP